ncbi:MAG: leucine-rich repeat domain-containing protein, partial [Treponema sp.]|nr:leucine-rich repeat domain-containing protein [Treponema sp.]
MTYPCEKTRAPGQVPFRAAFGLVLLACALTAACGNPAMKEVLRPLYEDEEEAAGPAYVITFSFGEGGGTAPTPLPAFAGTAIVLPGIGAMTAPSGRPVLTGWHNGAALYRPGAAYTVFYPVTLTARWDSIDNVLTAAIAAAAGAGKDGSAANPVPLALTLDLGTMPFGAWDEILHKIADKGKYVALDLTACGMTGGLFDTRGLLVGRPLITALTLPDAATGIEDGMAYIDSAFLDFTALTEVRGANIDTVGREAFSYCTALTTADFPAATSIGVGAFYSCTGLTSVNLPAATSIDYSAFANTGGAALTVTLGAIP